jgi:hypothetical protein
MLDALGKGSNRIRGLSSDKVRLSQHLQAVEGETKEKMKSVLMVMMGIATPDERTSETAGRSGVRLSAFHPYKSVRPKRPCNPNREMG